MYNFTTFNFIDFKIKYDNYDIVGDIVMEDNKSYKLLDRDGRTYLSKEKGSLGGNKRLKIYGRLDCPSANYYLSKGQYIENRVFFINEETAIGAGYRPCAKCMKKEYIIWRNKSNNR